MGWLNLLILFLVSLVLCSVGFKKYVYFLSIGYGFAVAGVGITLAIMAATGALTGSTATLAFCLLFVVYGARLSGYLLVREFKNAAYRKTLKEASGDESKMPMFVKVSIWLCVAVLYVAQTAPVYFRMLNESASEVLAWVGVIISICGVGLEALADRQKTEQKKARPDMVAMNGLYKFVRCPNYLGEILFWTGVFVSSLNILSGAGQWITAILGYICIVYIMFNGAQRLEKRQMKRYTGNAEYQAYADKTPIILPFVPLYHLNKPEGK